jgi:hypothetical protein
MVEAIPIQNLIILTKKNLNSSIGWVSCRLILMTRGVTKIRHLPRATTKGDTRFSTTPIQGLTMCNDCVNFDSLHEEKSIRPYENVKTHLNIL